MRAPVSGNAARGRDLNIDIVPSSRPHVIADLHRIPLLDECVDTVVSIAVLEHVRYPWLVAEEFHRVLRPAGHGVICVPFLQPRARLPQRFRPLHRGWARPS